ncbi:MAG: DUF4360 domain-containing protein [Thiotrichaceae bacterium]|nr:DUF4360 domain-containing protein [Thiotrichaceae bacterium]
MLNTVKAFAAITLISLVASQSATAGDLKMTKVGYAGNGCPSGSADVSIAPGGKAVSVLFDEFYAEAGINNRTFDRKKCDISITMKIPRGFSISLVNADYRGFIELPKRASAVFSREYFFAGTRGPRFVNRWNGSRSEEFFKKDRLAVWAHTWSPCGANVILRAKTAIKVKTRRNQQAMAGVDSVDVKSDTIVHHRGPHALDFRLRWKPCKM